jgi:hypothetical protein
MQVGFRAHDMTEFHAIRRETAADLDLNPH